MKNFKLKCLTVAVAASLTSLPSIAAEDTTSLTKRIEDLESKAASNDFYFTGYARYGMLYGTGDNDLVGFGSTDRTIGRLGNEYNGGEFQLTKKYMTDSGIKWDLAVMLDHWVQSDWGSTGDVNLKKFYASVTNFVESQPGLVVWAGRDFHQRPQQGLNDHYILTNDGQGGGFKNLDLGMAKLDMGFVGQVATNEGALGDDSGNYAITAKLGGMDAGFVTVDLYADYGFTSDKSANDGANNAQVAGVFALKDSNDRLVLRYAYNSLNSAFQFTANDQSAIYVSWEGGLHPSDNLYIDYLGSFLSVTNDDDEDKIEVAGIIRPMYNWDEVHSTWLEAGLGMIDQDGGDSTGWKLTLSQNISMGGLPGSRPMLRFYATAGSVDPDDGDKTDTLSFGAMFEAWW